MAEGKKENYQKNKFSLITAPKILSLVFAVVFWIFVMDKVNPDMTKSFDNVPVEIMGENELNFKGFEILGERDFLVNLKISGRRSEVLNVSRENLNVAVNIGNLSKGTQDVMINTSVIGKDVTISEISEKTVMLFIDEIVRKPVDVVIDVEGEVPEGYFRDEVNLSLQQVFINGPESYIKTVDKISGLINISNLTKKFEKDIAVSAVDVNGEVVTEVELETNYVTVEIPILKIKEVSVYPNVVGEIKEGYEVTKVDLYPKVIEVAGDRDLINGVKLIETLPVNVGNIDSSFEVQTRVVYPEGVYGYNSDNIINVLVTVEKIVTKEFIFAADEISLINLKPNFRTSLKEAETGVIVSISAIESVINRLTRDDIALYIDAENFIEGMVTAYVEVNHGGDYTDIGIVPNRITMEVNDINSDESSDLD